MAKIKTSILDLAAILDGQSLQKTFENSLLQAQHAEKLGFTRIWLAEHHNMASIASSATAILIGYLSNGTSTIRVGSGGIMLPNHSSLVIAEQFGTLDGLYPGRIDLGVGRAPGTDGRTAQALGRNPYTVNEGFPQQIRELQQYFSADNKTAAVRAIPGEGQEIPIYMLGSSTDSAYLAAEMGLPYAFAGHFAPAQMREAFRIYRQHFKPSKALTKPYTMAAVNIIAADTPEKADRLSRTLFQAFLNIIRNDRRPFTAPPEDWQPNMSEQEEAHLQYMLALSFIGNKELLTQQLLKFCNDLKPDELIVVSHIYDFADKLRSNEIIKEVVDQLEMAS